MNKFDFRLHTNSKPTKWRPAECRVVIGIHVFDRSSMFSQTVLASVQTLCPYVFPDCPRQRSDSVPICFPECPSQRSDFVPMFSPTVFASVQTLCPYVFPDCPRQRSDFVPICLSQTVLASVQTLCPYVFPDCPRQCSDPVPVYFPRLSSLAFRPCAHMFSPTVLASVQALCPPCASQLLSLEQDKAILPAILRISHVSSQNLSQ